jgi:NADPH:quinone reductase-like Zn-dependent oxidoreductase
MKAVICGSYGAPHDVLRLDEIGEPDVADDEVLVQVYATSVNAADWHIIRGVPAIARLEFGLRKPSVGVPGCDVAGRVEAVGKDVTTLRPGDDVFATSFMHGFGTFAERASVAESLVALKPSNLTFEQAAAVPLAAATALQGLRDHGHIEAAQRVLVVGASGGVGTFAVQIAKSFGAEVTGVCSTGNTDMVRSLGADHVIDYTTTDFTDDGHRYDLILQAAGTHSPAACRRALTAKGTLVQISGDSANRWIGPLTRIVTGRLLSSFVSQTITTFTVQPNRGDLDFLRTLIEAGQVSPVLDRSYPLTDIHDAVRHVETGHTRGKVVVTVGAAPANAGEASSHDASRLG